jgi:hypothetical protein
MVINAAPDGASPRRTNFRFFYPVIAPPYLGEALRRGAFMIFTK